MWEQLLFPVLSLGGLSFIFGAGLSLASRKFVVETDPRIEEVKDALPGVNCGACGYPGCDGLATAIVAGKAPVDACPVGGTAVAKNVSAIMGIYIETTEKKIAQVICRGDCEKAIDKYQYEGIADCVAASMLADGNKGCSYGCLGLGTCVRVCPFDAIHITKKGIAEVDREKCTACGLCVKACPKNIIELIPMSSQVLVACNSKDTGRIVRNNCQVGCIGCRICVKTCPVDAFIFENNLARIDYNKCTNCEECVKKCPTNAIISK
ncbi:MAG: RnfABCDGE type electron transport complex subunit B [Caldicoprobacterales bacterium]|jgi:electron transport complex protein RnfB|nr:Fe-S cluster domain-containing protein [Clostridiales bacterium]